MSRSLTRIGLTTGLCLVVALTLVAPNALAKKKSKALAAYSGRTINTTPGAARGTNFVNLEIHRWTTDEERQELAEILVDEGSEALVRSMRDDSERVGWVRLPGTTSYDFKYARQIETPEGLQIVLATDRPVGMRELARNARTLDYGATIIEFLMPADGEPGEGNIIIGAELQLDADGKLTIETASMNPVRFNNIKQTK